MKFSCLVITLLTYLFSNAQIVRQPPSVKYVALNAYSKSFTDVFSATNNQASVADLKTGGFAVYGERRYMFEELKAFTSVLAIPTKSGTIGFQGDYFGGAGFNESELGLFYARKVTKAVDVGVQFNYYNVRIAGYGTASAMNVEVGAIIHLTASLHAGLHIYNPTGSKLGNTGNEKLAEVYKAGVGYEASPQLFISAEVVKQEQQRIAVNAAMQYNLHKNIFLKTGISTLLNNIYGGISYQFAIARVEAYAAYHPQLGLTPGIMLIVNFKKTDED